MNFKSILSDYHGAKVRPKKKKIKGHLQAIHKFDTDEQFIFFFTLIQILFPKDTFFYDHTIVI